MIDVSVESTVGQNVAKFRSQRGMTQAELAEAIGVSVAFVSRVERGQKMMKVATLQAMARALHVSCDALLSSNSPDAYRENILLMLSTQPPEALPKIERLVRFFLEELNQEGSTASLS